MRCFLFFDTAAISSCCFPIAALSRHLLTLPRNNLLCRQGFSAVPITKKEAGMILIPASLFAVKFYQPWNLSMVPAGFTIKA